MCSFEFEWEGGGGRHLFEAGHFINFFCLWDGHLFEVGANSRSGTY